MDREAELRSDENTAATPHPRRRRLIERSASGGPILRLDDALLLRGGRATWLLDIDVKVGGGHRRLQVPIGRHKVLDRLILELERAITAGEPTGTGSR